MDRGYANPSGRSPLLGGFYDGTGNPFGEKLEATVFGKPSGNGTYLAWFRVGFDEERFLKNGLGKQETLIGREKLAGRPLRRPAQTSHKDRAGADPKVSIYRQPFIFDDGPNETGLLFASLQASPSSLKKILAGFMLGSNQKPADPFVSYMRFESAALYYVPSSPPGSFPGSIRFGGK
jgi:deferrochelatase/peroxidase EfeB